MALLPVGFAHLLEIYLIIAGTVAGDPLGTTGALPLNAGRTNMPLNSGALTEPGETQAGSVSTPKSSRVTLATFPPKDPADGLSLSDSKFSDSVLPAFAPSSLPNFPGQQALAIGAAANTLRVPTMPRVDAFGLPDLSSLASGLAKNAKLGASLPLEDDGLSSKSSMMRRESVQSDIPIRTIESDISSHRRLNMNEEQAAEEPQRHKFPFQDSPEFTPEAIFSNHQLSPDVAEFLGHLAQRSRVNKKEYVKSVQQEAGLMQNKGKVATYADGEDDDRDDIEDMKRQVASGPKGTPLSYFFETIDSKTTAGSWAPAECAAIATNITTQYMRMKGKTRATWATAGPAGAMGRADIHTGLFFRRWKVGDLRQIARKLRLTVLSFLATQDAGRVKLHIWTDLDNHNSSIREILGPIAYHPELMDAINITQFDPKIEFAKAPPSLAQETLKERYKKNQMPELRPDLIRSVILYNYGGLWMDADTVLMKDVAPLLGEDWAYLVKGRQGAVEGALLSASKPFSHFANEYLISYVMREEPLDIDPTKEKPLLVELFNNDPSHTTLHVLPPCFLDSDENVPQAEEAVLAAGASRGSSFFGKAVAEPYREYFAVGIRDAIQDSNAEELSVLQEPAFLHYTNKEQDQDDDDPKPAPSVPTFAYHWRGNYGAQWARGSLADVAERTFMKKLNIHPKKH